jgi:peptide/nickel transport system substrate-binding protein
VATASRWKRIRSTGAARQLHKIIFKIVPDRNTVLTQLQTGELDLWVPFGGAFLSRVQAMQNVVLGRHAIYTYNHLDFNTTRPAVRDREVRRALRYAIDRVTLREKSRTASAFSRKRTSRAVPRRAEATVCCVRSQQSKRAAR